MPRKKKKTDWRSKPRIHRAVRKSMRICLRCTEMEHHEIASRASSAGQDISSYVVQAASGIKR
ncbi:MAG: hypothetical protein E4G90_06645 [Gemmatimonadales bacterium]|nr:MAG: hypothetical protein E4G90_06645 [Gemmatimonadales bacterium]